jgi:hypothetical protein
MNAIQIRSLKVLIVMVLTAVSSHVSLLSANPVSFTATASSGQVGPYFSTTSVSFSSSERSQFYTQLHQGLYEGYGAGGLTLFAKTSNQKQVTVVFSPAMTEADKVILEDCLKIARDYQVGLLGTFTLMARLNPDNSVANWACSSSALSSGSSSSSGASY